MAFVSSATRWRCPQGIVLLPVTDLDLPLPFERSWRKDNSYNQFRSCFACITGGCGICEKRGAKGPRRRQSADRGAGVLSQLTRLVDSRLFASKGLSEKT